MTTNRGRAVRRLALSLAVASALNNLVAYAADAETGARATGDQDDWITLGTFLPNGTCREDSMLVLIKEEGAGTLRVRVRGLTGSSRVVTNAEANGGKR